MSDVRRACVAQDCDGRHRGVAFFLTGADLEKLGFEQETRKIEYSVENGVIRLAKPKREVIQK